MSVGYWVLTGAFLGAFCGAAFGVGDVLIHYHYPYNPHYDMYPLPITLGLLATGDGIYGIIPGAIFGGIIGGKVRSAHAYREQVSREAVSTTEVWPPPPSPPAV